MLKILIVSLFMLQQLLARQSLDYKLKEVTINEDIPVYHLKCAYPRIEDLQDSLVQSRCNRRIDSMITDWVKTFEFDAREAVGEDTNVASTSDETISYEVDLATNRILSIEFGVGGYLSGAPHPWGSSMTLTFDLSSGNDIRLIDLFDPLSHFLDTLSTYCISDLRSEEGLSADDPITGASPKLEHFQQFTLGKESLLILFPEYSIAPRAFAPGGFTVEIPYTALRNVLRKNGPIDSLLK